MGERIELGIKNDWATAGSVNNESQSTPKAKTEQTVIIKKEKREEIEA